MARIHRSFVDRLLTRLGLGCDRRIQSYEITYQVTLKNRAQERQRATLILPCSPSTESQELLDKSLFDPQMEVRQEPRFGNRYAFADFDLGTAPVSVCQTFHVTVHPVQADSLPSFTIGAYAHIDKQRLVPYLESNKFIRMTDEIRELAQKIVESESDVVEILRKLNTFVVQRLKYGQAITGLYSAQDALDKPEVDCGGFDSLFCSLAVALGIPSRIVCGFWVGDASNEMHAWVECFLPDGRWLPVDPSVEHLRGLRRTRRLGGFGSLGSDRIIVSYGCDFDLQIGGRVVRCDILQNPIVVSEHGEESVEVSHDFQTFPASGGIPFRRRDRL